MNQNVYHTYVDILNKELVTALGCTEPIAIAFAGAKVREVLGRMPERCEVLCSGNIVKNVKGVTVPNSGGMKGIDTAAVLGIVGGDAGRNLAVLEHISEEQIALTKKLLEEGFCSCGLIEGVENLYIIITARAGEESASIEIRNFHSNITKIIKNGTVIYTVSEKAGSCDRDACSLPDGLPGNLPDDLPGNPPEGLTGNLPDDLAVSGGPDKSLLNVKDILEFGNSLNLADIEEIIAAQIKCNTAISAEGLAHPWGAQVGRTLLEAFGSSQVVNRAKAAAAAGSDARMSGCPMPVVINSGSGNQGMTVSLPVIEYAKEYRVPDDRLYRALAVANLISIHQKKYIGSLSAYCGAVSAACGSAVGIAWMFGGSYEEICGIITDTIATVGGMVCDGAKPSCAAKIACAVDCALTALQLSRKGRVFQPGEGLVKETVEETIRSVGRMGREGMKATDIEILNIMLGK